MSSDTSFYVYSLKDPRTSPAKPFYIGKGAGARASHHMVRPDKSRKGDRIRDIEAAGHKVLVTHLADSLTEHQAIKLEAELISAFGTVDTGGFLLNSVVPSGLSTKVRSAATVPTGVKEKAQVGLTLLKEAVLELARANPKGISNADASGLLGLRSDYDGGSHNYLTYSIMGLLMREGRLERLRPSKRHVARAGG